MSIKISIKKNYNDKLIKNLVLFCDEKYKIFGLSQLSINNQKKIINQSVLSNNLKDKKFLSFNINPNQKIILIKIKNKFNQTDIEKIGAKFFNFIKSNSILSSVFFEQNIFDLSQKNKYFLDDFLHGVRLKSYLFDKYKSKKSNEIFQQQYHVKIKLKILIKIKDIIL